MDSALKCIILYFIVISLVSVIAMISDKLRAKSKKSRVPEIVLFLLVLLGGSFAVYISMSVFNHKTKKPAFVFIIPIIFFLQCLALHFSGFLG